MNVYTNSREEAELLKKQGYEQVEYTRNNYTGKEIFTMRIPPKVDERVFKGLDKGVLYMISDEGILEPVKDKRVYSKVEILAGTDLGSAIEKMMKLAMRENELKYIVFNGKVIKSDNIQLIAGNRY